MRIATPSKQYIMYRVLIKITKFVLKIINPGTFDFPSVKYANVPILVPM